MNINDVRNKAFAMPLTSPAYPPGPYRFANREYLVITYRTGRREAPGPSAGTVDSGRASGPLRIHPHAGFNGLWRLHGIWPGDSRFFPGPQGHVHTLHVSQRSSADRRRSGALGISQKAGQSNLADGNRHADWNARVWRCAGRHLHHGLQVRRSRCQRGENFLGAPNFLFKIMPHVDGTPRICELVEYYLEDIVVKGAWTGPGALSLAPHALAPVAELPVLDVVSAQHFVADLTLGLGKVVHDYLA